MSQYALAQVLTAYAMTLRIHQTDHRQYVPFIERIDEGLSSLLHCGAPLPGMALMDWIPGDAGLADEWMRGYLYGESTTTLHQFSQAARRWLHTRLEREPGRLTVVISEMSEDEPLQGYVFTKMQTLTMGMAGAFYSWELDLRKGAAYFPFTTNRLLCGDASWRILPIGEFMQLIHPEDLAAVQEALVKIDAYDHAVEHRGLTPSGTIYLRSYAYPYRDEEGNLTRIMGQSQDISQQKLAQEASCRSEQRFRSIVEYSGDQYFLLDDELRCLYSSPPPRDLADIFPIVARDAQDAAKALLSLLDRESRHALYGAIRHTLATAKNACVTVRLPAGRDMRWYSCSVAPFPEENAHKQAILIVRDVSSERWHADQVEYIHQHDALTGLYNRTRFESEMARIEAEGLENICLILGDVNGLKLTNDAFGYAAGDQLLCETRDILLNACGPQDQVMRIGNDEFVLLLPDATMERGEGVCAAIRAACEQRADDPLPLTVSLGLAHRSSAEEPMGEVFQRAEGRLHANKLLASRSLHSQLTSSLKEALRFRNMETAEHMQRMERMAVRIGRYMQLSSSNIDELILLAALHDIGKISIPDSVINKPGPLSEQEWEIMRTHSSIGHRIAMSTSELAVIAQGILCHHEKWDGSGYPLGLSGKDIPLNARIISLVDAYDCMTNARIYKGPIPHATAVEELRRCAGTHFDPELVKIFLELFGEEGTGGNDSFLERKESKEL